MSSTSSSECMCPDCLQYGVNFRTVQAKNPFYQAFGQPLIYYAQMKQKPQFYDKRCKESRKCEPNFFVKAFRWYTQEHTIIRSSNTRPRDNNKRDMSEFALWLDKKYDQFLTEKQNYDCCPTTPKNTATCGDDKMFTSARHVPPPPCNSYQTRTFSRIRSPWGKKDSSRERTTTIEKRLQSLEFILEPKELSRPASEFYQQTPTYKRSKISVVSSESRITKKTVTKSRISERTSAIELNRNMEPKINKHKEEKPLKSSESPKEKKHITKLKEEQPLKSSERLEGKKQRIYYSAKDVSCQCPETKLVTVDAQTQYHNLCACPPKENMSVSEPAQQVRDNSRRQSQPPTFVTKEVNKKQSDCPCQCSLDVVPKNDTASQYTYNRVRDNSQRQSQPPTFVTKEVNKKQSDCSYQCSLDVVPKNDTASQYTYNRVRDNSQRQSQPPTFVTKEVNKKQSDCPCQCSLDVVPKNDTASKYSYNRDRDNSQRQSQPPTFVTKEVNKKQSDCPCQCSLDVIPKNDTASQYTYNKYRNVESYFVLGATAYNGNGSSKYQKDCYEVHDKSQGQSQPPKYVTKDVNKKRSNCSCQCSLDVIPKNDTASQYTEKYTNVKSHYVLGTTEYNWNDSSEEQKGCFKEVPLIITRCVCPCEPIRIQKSLKTTDNQTSTDVTNNKNRFVKISNKCVALQTSDNSIDLERDGVRKYPLFMKIVYADKLKEDRPHV